MKETETQKAIEAEAETKYWLWAVFMAVLVGMIYGAIITLLIINTFN